MGAWTRRRRRWIVLIGAILVGDIGITAGLIIWQGPSLVANFEFHTRVQPENFRIATELFIEGVESREIRIYDKSLAEMRVEELPPWSITVRPFDLSERGAADRKNMWAHLNNAALVFACHEVLHGDQRAALRILELLQIHDPGEDYDYPSDRKVPFGDRHLNAWITLERLQSAAESFVAGDLDARDVLEGPARQWPFLLELRQREWSKSGLGKDE